ncbi:amino acid transporter [Microbacterium karelineae]|uniref:amino acid transporter n=1 Tax=Microbacterium karelineae TaxID=2654283 RepID=UPI0012E9A748|nr:amino acid transporter [Microbacterium karelineae]
MTDKPTRRDLMKPVHLLGFAFAAALFAGFVTALSTGAFTEQPGVVGSAWRLAAIVAGIVFIVVLLSLALLLLVVDPRDVVRPHDGPVMKPGADEDQREGDGEAKAPDGRE